jgi:hypothetical protein
MKPSGRSLHWRAFATVSPRKAISRFDTENARLTTDSLLLSRYNLPQMETTYSITPEMLGLTWPRLCRMALLRSAIYFVVAISIASLFHGHWPMSLSAAVLGSIADFALIFTVRFNTPRGLRVTDDSIEEVDGPIIHRNEIVDVIEHSDREPRGFEIVGRRSTSWLPKYHIFVPAALPGFNELRQLAYSWKG